MIAIISIYIFGIAFILLLEKLTKVKLPFVLFFPISFLVGLFCIVSELFIFSLLFHYWSIKWLFILNMIVCGIIIFWQKDRLHEAIVVLKNYFKNIAKADYIFYGIILTVCYFIWQTQLQHNFIHSDALTYWFIKAKFFFTDKWINPATLTNPMFSTAYDYQSKSSLPTSIIHYRYPIFSSLAITWIFLVENAINIVSAKYLWLGIEISLLFFLYWDSKKIFPKYPHAGLIGPLFYLGMPFNSWHYSVHSFGFADIWLATYLVTGVSFLYFWSKENNLLYLWLSIILLSCASFNKIEGVIIIWFLPYFMFCKKLEIKQKILSCLLLLLFIVTWYGFTFSFPKTNSYENQIIANVSFSKIDLSRLSIIIKQMIINLFSFKNYLILWPLYLLFTSLAIFRKKISLSLLWIHGLIVVHTLFILATYFFMPLAYPIKTAIDSSVSRYASQIIPTTIFLFLLTIQLLFFNLKRK